MVLLVAKNDKFSLSDMFSINGKLESDAVKISNGFCDFFTNVGKSCAAKIVPSMRTSESYLTLEIAQIIALCICTLLTLKKLRNYYKI